MAYSGPCPLMEGGGGRLAPTLPSAKLRDRFSIRKRHLIAWSLKFFEIWQENIWSRWWRHMSLNVRFLTSDRVLDAPKYPPSPKPLMTLCLLKVIQCHKVKNVKLKILGLIGVARFLVSFFYQERKKRYLNTFAHFWLNLKIWKILKSP